MSDWKENKLGEMPCKPFDMVDVWFRGGDLSSGFASDFYWKIDHDIADIIKYRVRDNKTETPEEKEALDMIDTTSKQVDSLANNSELPNSSEWKNGDECEHGHHNYSGANKMTYIGAHPFVSGKHVCLSELKGIVIVDSIWLRKPETPEQKAERERLEFIKLMCETVAKKCGSPSSIYEMYCAALYDAGYRKAK